MSAYPYTYPASPFRSAPGSPNVASSSYTQTYTSDPSSSASTTGAQPTTRSRTLLFISYRDSIARSAPSRSRQRRDRHDYPAHAHEHEGGDTDTLLFSADDEQQRLIGEEGHVSVDMDAALPPRWCVSRRFLPYYLTSCFVPSFSSPFQSFVSPSRFLFFLSLFPFGTEVAIMSGNLTLPPVHGFNPKLQASASQSKDELRFESSWDMHSPVPCLASRDGTFFTSPRLNPRLRRPSLDQAAPPDLPTFLSIPRFTPPLSTPSHTTRIPETPPTLPHSQNSHVCVCVFLHFHPSLIALSQGRVERKATR